MLTRVVGRGAAGTVWEAEHRLLTSKVAIKFLDTAALLDPTSAEILAQRFRFEAQISARLAASTKHLVAAHDAGMFRGIPYLVMELVAGETLDARLTRGPMSVEEAADMLDQLAEPIDASHGTGIAHRDIKPGNIMIVNAASGPFYKLGDFGTAKVFGEGLVGLTPPKQTSENTLVGSPAYMSPEYISGLPLANGAIDVWALAVTVYEGITGKLPFDGEVWTQVAVAIVAGEFPLPSTVVEGLPKSVDDVFARSFSQESGERYVNARHFARAFRQAIEVRTAPTPVVTDEVEPVQVPTNNPRKFYVLGGVAAALLVLFAVGFTVLNARAGKDTQASANAAEAKPSETPAATATQKASAQPVVEATQTSPTSASATSPTTASASESSVVASSKRPPRGTSTATTSPVTARTTPRTAKTVDKSEIH